MFARLFCCLPKKKTSHLANHQLCLSLLDMDTKEYLPLLEKITSKWNADDFYQTISRVEQESNTYSAKDKVDHLLQMLREIQSGEKPSLTPK